VSLAPRRRPLARVTLVPLIDVLFILLVYFMVTSVYLDLDMIPTSAGDEAAEAASPGFGGDGEGGAALLVRIDPAGRAVLRGETLDMTALEARLAEAVRGRPALEVLLLPSPRAPVQALASALDALSAAGVARSRVLRLEADP